MSEKKFVAITRSSQDAGEFKHQLEGCGVEVYELPTIRIIKNELSAEDTEAIAKVTSYAYIIFTSSHAATLFVELLGTLGVSPIALPPIVAVGQMTARTLTNLGLHVQVVPKKFTSRDLAKELVDIAGKRLLIPRSQIAPPDLLDALHAKGAEITEVHLYTTEGINQPDLVFSDLVMTNRIGCLTFSSPSSIAGFPGRLKDSTVLEKTLHLPTVCIGPTTAAAARERGFAQVVVANPFTIEGMVQKVQELV
jgi:uroporphyrinogen III methyltransferase/synthase